MTNPGKNTGKKHEKLDSGFEIDETVKDVVGKIQEGLHKFADGKFFNIWGAIHKIPNPDARLVMKVVRAFDKFEQGASAKAQDAEIAGNDEEAKRRTIEENYFAYCKEDCEKLLPTPSPEPRKNS